MCCSTCLVPPPPSLSPSHSRFTLGSSLGANVRILAPGSAWVAEGESSSGLTQLSPSPLGTVRAQSSPQQCWFLFALMGSNVQSRARRTSEHGEKLNCLGVPTTCCFLVRIVPKLPPYCTWQSYCPVALAPDHGLFVVRKEVKTCCAFQHWQLQEQSILRSDLCFLLIADQSSSRQRDPKAFVRNVCCNHNNLLQTSTSNQTR